MPSGNNNTECTQLVIEEVSRMITKYEEKLANAIKLQGNFQGAQIEHLGKILADNKDKINKQKQEIEELEKKIHTVETKVEGKILNLQKELQNFNLYYNQCYQYTLARVNEISNKMNFLTNQIKNQCQNSNIIAATQYVKYVNEMVIAMIKNTNLRTTQLRHYVNQQIFELQLMVSNFIGHFQQIDIVTDELKSISYGNSSLEESIINSCKFLKGSRQIEENQLHISKKIVGFFEPKFKEIIKRINSYSIQIQLVKTMINNDNKNMDLKQRQFQELNSRLEELEILIKEEKKNFQLQLEKKDDIIRKKNDKIGELQVSLHTLVDKQIEMNHQIAQLKIHNLQLLKQIECLQKRSQKEMKESRTMDTQTESSYGDQSKISTQASPPQLILEDSQKLLLIEMQYENLQRKYKLIENQLLHLKKEYQKDRKDQLRSQLLNSQKIVGSNSRKTLYEPPKHEMQKLSFNSCMKSPRNDHSHKDTMASSNYFNERSFDELHKQNQKLQQANLQLSKANKELQKEILKLLNTKTKQNEEEAAYLDQVQAQIEKNIRQIERLTNINHQLSRKIQQVQIINSKLEDELIFQGKQYEQKLNRYRYLINKLQKQNEVLKNQDKNILSHSKYQSQDEITSFCTYYGKKSMATMKNHLSQHQVQREAVQKSRQKKGLLVL